MIETIFVRETVAVIELWILPYWNTSEHIVRLLQPCDTDVCLFLSLDEKKRVYMCQPTACL